VDCMSDPLSVRAAFVRELGPTSNIVVDDLSIVGPGVNEVLVRVEAVCVNPVDTFVRSGGFDTALPLPLVLGRDLVGEVVRAPSFSQFQPGDRVWANTLGHDGRQGSSSSLAVVGVDRLYRVPKDVSASDIVALAHPATTAALAWFEHANLRKNMRVFVGGAGGNVGRAGVAIARWVGADVVASAGKNDLAHLEADGIAAIDYAAPDLAEQASADGLFDIVWDTSGHMAWSDISALTDIGATVLVTAAGNPTQIDWRPLYTRDVTIASFVHSRASAHQMARAASIVNRGASEGWLVPNIAEFTTLDAARQVHERMESGQVRGRIVLRVYASGSKTAAASDVE